MRYNYRLRPGKTALAALNAEGNRTRWVWNQCVARDRELWRQERLNASGRELCAELTDWRGRKEWLAEGSAVAQQQAINTWHKAKQDAFKVPGRGFPKFKGKRTALPSLAYVGTGFKIKNGKLQLAGKITIPIVWSRPLPGPPSSVRVFREADGHWYASFVVLRELPEPLATTGKNIGIDWGVSKTATTTDPAFDVQSKQHGRRWAKQLTREQRKMAKRRTPKGTPRTNGYLEAKKATAALHAKIARARQDDARKWAKKVVDAHDTIAVEDFRPKFLAKSKMARKAADISIGALKRELIERGRRYGRNVVLVSPQYSTMDCSNCGARAKRRLELSERTYACEACGHTADRDVNAAHVVLNRALAQVESDPGSVAPPADVESGRPGHHVDDQAA